MKRVYMLRESTIIDMLAICLTSILILFSTPLRATDSLNVTVVGHCDTPSKNAHSVFVKDSFAYIADDSSGIRIINVADPQAPFEVGYWKSSGVTVYDVNVVGNYAYVSVYDLEMYSLRVIDISIPTSPAEVGSCKVWWDNLAYGVFVSGSYAYLADNIGGLQIINISSPTNPFREGGYREANWYAKDVFTLDGYAYLVTAVTGQCTTGLHIIDITTPSNPSLTGDCILNDWCEDVYVVDTFAYVVSDGGFDIINVQDKTAPQEVGHLYTGRAYGVFVKDRGAYVAVSSFGTARISIINISNPASPSQEGFYELDNCGAKSIFVKDTLIYAALDKEGLYIFRYYGPPVSIDETEEGKSEIRNPELTICPNPCRDKVEIRFCIGQSAKGIGLKIYDMAGREVKHFSLLPFNFLLSTTVVWDGSDEQGNEVAPGIYFIKIVGATSGLPPIAKKVVVIR